MQNRNAVCGSGALPQSLLDQGRAADYRVMARCRSGAIALVSLARSTRQAISLAEQLRDMVIAQRATTMGRIQRQRQDGIAAIYLEAWAGTATEGRWEHFGPQRGGFYHVFRSLNCDRESPSRSGPKSGTAIPCVLLAERTRKGGWRAKLVNRELSGPITNWADMPQSAKPGQVVELRVGAVSNNGTHIQFHWLPSSGNGHGTKA
jgi:hypothetical protein